MNLLAIDTSSENISVGLLRKNEIAVDFNRRMKFGAGKILPFVKEQLHNAGVPLEKIDAFVVGAGPGSFTGMRISFSIVKAFSLSLGRPVIKVGSFFSLAYPFKDKHEKITVVSDARRGLVYAASFCVKKGILRRESKERLTLLEPLAKEKQGYFFVTYDEALRKELLGRNSNLEICPKNVWPRAAYLLPLAKEYYQQGKFTPLAKLEPLYLYPKTCQIRKRAANHGPRTTKNV